MGKLINIIKNELEKKLLNGELDPNSCLEEAIALKNYDIVKTLFNYGASIDYLLKDKKDYEAYFESLYQLNGDIGGYLSNCYIKEKENIKSNFEFHFDRFSNNYFKLNFGDCSKRSFKHTKEEGMEIYSVGLIEREAIDKQYHESLLKFLELENWGFRLSPDVLGSDFKQAVIAGITYAPYDEDCGSDYVTPNITYLLNFYIIEHDSFERCLGKIVFKQCENLIGSERFEHSFLFKLLKG